MRRYILSFANVASILGLAFATQIPIGGRVVIGIAGIGSLIYLFFKDKKENEVNERVCQSDEEVKKAMIELIRTQGKVCIVSRDLSWVDEEVAAYISAKANSILIFVEKETVLTQKLKVAGANIKFYGHLGYEPKTRFTIVRYNSVNPQVAIADTQNSIRKKGKFKHTIYQTVSNGSKQDKWINSLALDMMDLYNLVCEDEKNDKENKA